MSDETPNLFGYPDAEVLYDDPAAVWESEIKPFIDTDSDDPAYAEYGWDVEEWTSERAYRPGEAEWLLESYLEGALDEVCDDGETFNRLIKDPDVIAAIAALDALLVEKITYRNAVKKVATHRITLVDGEPMWDGEPMYRKAES